MVVSDVCRCWGEKSKLDIVKNRRRDTLRIDMTVTTDIMFEEIDDPLDPDRASARGVKPPR